MPMPTLVDVGADGFREIPDTIREYLSTGYWLRFSMEIYGSKREKTVFHKYLQEYWFVLTEISESLRKPPGVYGRM